MTEHTEAVRGEGERLKDGNYLFREDCNRWWRAVAVKHGMATGRWLSGRMPVSSLLGYWRGPLAEDNAAYAEAIQDGMGRLKRALIREEVQPATPPQPAAGDQFVDANKMVAAAGELPNAAQVVEAFDSNLGNGWAIARRVNDVTMYWNLGDQWDRIGHLFKGRASADMRCELINGRAELAAVKGELERARQRILAAIGGDSVAGRLPDAIDLLDKKVASISKLEQQVGDAYDSELATARETIERLERELSAIDEEIRGPKIGGDGTKALEHVRQLNQSIRDMDNAEAQRMDEGDCPKCARMRFCCEQDAYLSIRLRDICKDLRSKLTTAIAQLAEREEEIQDLAMRSEGQCCCRELRDLAFPKST